MIPIHALILFRDSRGEHLLGLHPEAMFLLIFLYSSAFLRIDACLSEP